MKLTYKDLKLIKTLALKKLDGCFSIVDNKLIYCGENNGFMSIVKATICEAPDHPDCDFNFFDSKDADKITYFKNGCDFIFDYLNNTIIFTADDCDGKTMFRIPSDVWIDKTDYDEMLNIIDDFEYLEFQPVDLRKIETELSTIKKLAKIKNHSDSFQIDKKKLFFITDAIFISFNHNLELKFPFDMKLDKHFDKIEVAEYPDAYAFKSVHDGIEYYSIEKSDNYLPNEAKINSVKPDKDSSHSLVIPFSEFTGFINFHKSANKLIKNKSSWLLGDIEVKIDDDGLLLKVENTFCCLRHIIKCKTDGIKESFHIPSHYLKPIPFSGDITMTYDFENDHGIIFEDKNIFVILSKITYDKH
ncbi:hypothetical protein AGMMS50268_33750 [Spirochaetia bacterium]|nr:hypothetical protein AGMMS50268_33750 [Spirochaetia bacterium]